LSHFIEQAYEKPVIHQHYKHIYPYQQLATPICYINHEIALPLSGLSTHLLWVGKDERHFVQWHFWRGVAKKMGLRVPHCHLERHGQYHYLIMERSDRKLNDQNQIIRVHQENFLQSLGFSSKLKFSKSRLHYLNLFFSICQKASVPAIARSTLMKQIMLRYILKRPLYPSDLSVLYESHQNPIIAPCQGVHSTSGISLDNLDWASLCEEIHYSFKALQRELNDFQVRFDEAISLTRQEFHKNGFPI
jgi:hypothetical protein